jgi:hypothetical protein
MHDIIAVLALVDALRFFQQLRERRQRVDKAASKQTRTVGVTNDLQQFY